MGVTEAAVYSTEDRPNNRPTTRIMIAKLNRTNTIYILKYKRGRPRCVFSQLKVSSPVRLKSSTTSILVPLLPTTAISLRTSPPLLLSSLRSCRGSRTVSPGETWERRREREEEREGGGEGEGERRERIVVELQPRQTGAGGGEPLTEPPPPAGERGTARGTAEMPVW